MSVAERHLDPEHAPDDLEFVLEQVGVGNYADALQALSRVKAGDARNIFLIALEKQVLRLRNGGILPRERSEIVESLPGLVERARANRGSRTSSGEPAPSQEAPPSHAGERKDPRVRMVVDQYFRHADEWVRKRDFEAALKEIERILLIDPENRVAKEYQKRVRELFRSERHEGAGTVSASVAEVTSVAEVPAAAAQQKVGKLVVILSIGIAVALVVAIGVLFLRSSKSQYKVGYMYVMPAAPATQEEIAAAAAAPAADAPASAEAATEATPEVKPPEEARPSTTRSNPKPAVKEEKAADPEPAKAQPADPAAVSSAPTTAAVSSAPAPAVAPSAITQPQKISEEPTAASRFIPVEQPPRIVQLEQPKFSDDQMSRGIQGDIVVKVQIDRTGKPLQARIVSSTNPALDAAVIDAVLRSSYAPGIMSNGPVTSWMTIPLKLK